MNNTKKLLNIKEKKISQTKYIWILPFYLIPWIMLVMVLVAIESGDIIKNGVDFRRLVLNGLIAILTFLPIILIYILAMREKKHYNALRENGIVLCGEIKNIVESPLGFIRFVVEFMDRETGQQYFYNQQSYEIRDTKKLMTFVKENNAIYILVNEENYKDGYILFEEYFERQDWDGIKNTHTQRIDGSYKVALSEDKCLLENKHWKRVTGKLLKKSIRETKYYSFSGVVKIEADVTYFDDESGRIMVFHGCTDILPAIQWKLARLKETLYVQVEYDPFNEKNCIVYLAEALEELD